MKLNCKLILLIAACAIVFPPACAQAQAVLDRTTLGQRQNDSQDLVNSLIPGPRSYGKGEKKEQVNPAELKSKSVKDTTFGGSLLDMGIVGAAPKLDEQKRRSAPGENDSKAPKEAHAGSDKESKGSTATAGDAQNKEQRSTSAATDQKPSATSTEKTSVTKPDGGR